MTIEEEEGAQGLVLGRCAYPGAGGEVGQEGGDFLGTEGAWVLFVVKEDEGLDPMPIGFFGAGAVVA